MGYATFFSVLAYYHWGVIYYLFQLPKWITTCYIVCYIILGKYSLFILIPASGHSYWSSGKKVTLYCKCTQLMLMHSESIHLANGVHLQVHLSFHHFPHFLQDYRFPSGVIRPSTSPSTELTKRSLWTSPAHQRRGGDIHSEDLKRCPQTFRRSCDTLFQETKTEDLLLQ